MGNTKTINDAVGKAIEVLLNAMKESKIDKISAVIDIGDKLYELKFTMCGMIGEGVIPTGPNPELVHKNKMREMGNLLHQGTADERSVASKDE